MIGLITHRQQAVRSIQFIQNGTENFMSFIGQSCCRSAASWNVGDDLPDFMGGCRGDELDDERSPPAQFGGDIERCLRLGRMRDLVAELVEVDVLPVLVDRAVRDEHFVGAYDLNLAAIQ